jgi:hypothetical protein
MIYKENQMAYFDFSGWLHRRCLDRKQQEVIRATDHLRALGLRVSKKTPLSITFNMDSDGTGFRVPLTDVIQVLRLQLPDQLLSEEDFNAELNILIAAARAIEAKERDKEPGCAAPTNFSRGAVERDGVSGNLPPRGLC